MSARHHLRRAVAAGVALAAAIGLAPTPAHAAPAPFHAFEQWVGGSTVQVGGTYTPIVGNFAGGRADDIFWYAPGSTPDYLWISSTTRGSFTKVRKDVSGTYRPLVGDFVGDSFDDILWYAPGTAPDNLWQSVDTPASFTSKPIAINGTYQPLALDQTLTWPMALAASGPPEFTGTPKDRIVWYAPGTAADTVWRFRADGSGRYDQSSVAIAGSPRLIPLNVNNDPYEDFLAYQPGSGADALFQTSGSGFTRTAKTVNGTYNPVPLGGGYYDSILWHGPGSAPDALWTNGGGTYENAGVDPIGTTGAPVPVEGFAAALLYEPNGPDRGLVSGATVAVLDPDQGPGARVIRGDFDFDLGLDAFFYRPGSGAESIGFAAPPNFST